MPSQFNAFCMVHQTLQFELAKQLHWDAKLRIRFVEFEIFCLCIRHLFIGRRSAWPLRSAFVLAGLACVNRRAQMIDLIVTPFDFRSEAFNGQKMGLGWGRIEKYLISNAIKWLAPSAKGNTTWKLRMCPSTTVAHMNAKFYGPTRTIQIKLVHRLNWQ